jgi:hypothetical protein
MNCKVGKIATVVVALALGIGGSASAQVFTGRIEVTIEDATGARLPGATVELTARCTKHKSAIRTVRRTS